jgi:hypothetical protein
VNGSSILSYPDRIDNNMCEVGISDDPAAVRYNSYDPSDL